MSNRYFDDGASAFWMAMGALGALVLGLGALIKRALRP